MWKVAVKVKTITTTLSISKENQYQMFSTKFDKDPLLLHWDERRREKKIKPKTIQPLTVSHV